MKKGANVALRLSISMEKVGSGGVGVRYYTIVYPL